MPERLKPDLAIEHPGGRRIGWPEFFPSRQARNISAAIDLVFEVPAAIRRRGHHQISRWRCHGEQAVGSSGRSSPRSSRPALSSASFRYLALDGRADRLSPRSANAVAAMSMNSPRSRLRSDGGPGAYAPHRARRAGANRAHPPRFEVVGHSVGRWISQGGVSIDCFQSPLQGHAGGGARVPAAGAALHDEPHNTSKALTLSGRARCGGKHQRSNIVARARSISSESRRSLISALSFSGPMYGSVSTH